LIFGATGGVMEAAIRTAYEIVTGEEVPFDKLRITPVRGMDGVKTAELPITKAVADWKFLEGATLKLW
jgi:NADP-reducing hydrogenase subunit HndD